VAEPPLGSVQILGDKLLRRPLLAVVLHAPRPHDSESQLRAPTGHPKDESPAQANQRREAVLGGAARHGEAAVRAGVGGRERLAEHVRHPREPLLHGLPVVAVPSAPVLGPSAQPPRDILHDASEASATRNANQPKNVILMDATEKPNRIQFRWSTVASANLVLGDEGELGVHLVRGRVRLQRAQEDDKSMEAAHPHGATHPRTRTHKHTH